MTDTSLQKPKFKFKKRNIKKQKQLRKAIDDEDSSAPNGAPENKINNDTVNDTNEQYDGGALGAILAVERRRKLFNTKNRGVDSTHLLKASPKITEDSTTITEPVKNKDLEERLKGTFSEGKLAGSNDMGGDEEGGILAKKHKRAMEEFIQKKLQGGGSGDGKIESTSAGAGPTEDEKEMFAELLLSSDNASSTNNIANASQAKDGDIGAGGAMMMGSGIAEVALPASQRLKTLKETEKAVSDYEKARNRQGRQEHNDRNGNDDLHLASANDHIQHEVPMNFAAGPGKRKRQESDMVSTTAALSTETPPTKSLTSHHREQPINSSAAYSASSAGTSVQRSDVSTLGQSYSHNFQLHQQDWIAQRRDERQSEIDTIKTQQQADEAEDSSGRMGFAMARRVAKGEKGVRPPPARGPNGESLRNEWDRTKGGNQRSNDDRVWRQFMAKNKR